MMSDVTDVSLVKTKTKQEGFMYSMMETIQSIFQAAIIYVMSLILDNEGYSDSAPTQPLNVQWALRNICCALPSIGLLMIWLLGTIYPLNRAKHAKYVSQLKKYLRKGESVIFLDTKDRIFTGRGGGRIDLLKNEDQDENKFKLLSKARESKRQLTSTHHLNSKKSKRIHVGDSSEQSIGDNNHHHHTEENV